jgi:hypothetical protein
VGVQSRANKERLVGGPQPRAACDPRRQKEKSTRFRWEITCICCVVHPPTRRLPGTCSPTPSPPPCLSISRGMKNSTSVRISLPFGASCESGPLYGTSRHFDPPKSSSESTLPGCHRVSLGTLAPGWLCDCANAAFIGARRKSRWVAESTAVRRRFVHLPVQRGQGRSLTC